jgi:hypothetical protein
VMISLSRNSVPARSSTPLSDNGANIMVLCIAPPGTDRPDTSLHRTTLVGCPGDRDVQPGDQPGA